MNPIHNRNPVILVHGLWDRSAIFNTLSAYLQNLGWSVHRFDLIPNDGKLPLEKLAEQLASRIEERLDPSQPFDLVGFSMGGIVSRYYIQRLGGVDRTQRFVTISSPHRGTWTAYATTQPGCVQMRPNSEFLQDLNRDAAEVLGKLDFTSIWTPYDLMILPASSSELSLGTQIQIPVPLHAWMVKDERTLKVLTSVLSN
ncbi:MAG: triacylglycerol lipase [Geitlerinemataceae cyanobacterium]